MAGASGSLCQRSAAKAEAKVIAVTSAAASDIDTIRMVISPRARGRRQHSADPDEGNRGCLPDGLPDPEAKTQDLCQPDARRPGALVPPALRRQPALRLRHRRRALDRDVLLRHGGGRGRQAGARRHRRQPRAVRRRARLFLRRQPRPQRRGQAAGRRFHARPALFLGFRRHRRPALRRDLPAGRPEPQAAGDAALLGGARPHPAGQAGGAVPAERQPRSRP